MINNKNRPNKNAFKPRSLVEARCGLKASENDIFDMLLSYINKDNDIADNLTYTLVIDNFKDKFGLKYEKNAYKKIRDGVGQLKGKTIDIWSDNGARFESYVLFQTIKWHDGSGKITVKLGEDIKKMLVQQKQSITYYEIRYTLPMNSRYSKRLYVMFKEWSLSSQKTRYDRVDNLREKLQVPVSYGYNKFKKRVLEESIHEINESTDIFVDYEERKKTVRGGSKVVGLEFKIKIKESECVTDQIEQVGAEMIIDYLKLQNVTNITQKQAVIVYRAAQKAKLTDRQIKNRINIVLDKKVIRNMVGYLIFAMSDKFETPKEVRAGFDNFSQRNYSKEFFELLEKSLLCPERMSEEEQTRLEELRSQANLKESMVVL